jgi:hypothetical protein
VKESGAARQPLQEFAPAAICGTLKSQFLFVNFKGHFLTLNQNEMNAKTIIAAILAALAFFFLGWLIWGILLHSTMDQYANASCMKPMEELNMTLLIIANLIWGYVYAYIFSNWNGPKTFSSGLLPGALINVLIGLGIEMFNYTFTTINNSMTPMWINIIPNAVIGAIAGGLVCWWLGRGTATRSV